MSVDEVRLKKKTETPAKIIKIAETIQDDILSYLDDLGVELFDNVYNLQLQQFVAKTTKQLDETIEKSLSPVKVSLIGPFSSGKTITLCTLLKQPNLLPRANQPTSGNVVEVQIVPPNSSNDTNIMQCHLFSPLDLEDMLRDYYDYLHSQYNYNLPNLEKLPEQAGFLREKINFLCQNILNILENQWNQPRNQQQGLNHLADLYLILLTVRHYLNTYSEISNTSSVVLSIPYNSQDEQSQDRLISVTMLDQESGADSTKPETVQNKIQERIEALPNTLDELKHACQQGNISNSALRALLPLYKRIVLTQEMDLKDWKGADKITFVDFPGIGSNNRRDVYLSRKSLSEAHVNMLFFLANRPTIADADPLIKIIGDAKQYLNNLDERIIPVINFFDSYGELPENVDQSLEENHSDAQERAWQRVQNFFYKQKIENVNGLGVGFDVFDKSILGQLFSNPKGWNYFLLSPVVSADQELLTEKECTYLTTYRDQQTRYGQLLEDLKTSIKYLKGEPELQKQHASEIDKYNRLIPAISAYQNDGGISKLRKILIKKLKTHGSKLILEDALPPLLESLRQLDDNLITPLRQAIEEELEDETRDAIDNKEARNRVIALWDQMQVLTGHSAGSSEIILMHRGYQVTDPRCKETDYVKPLELCKYKVLRTVLEDDFWQEWAERWISSNTENQATPLTDLVERYHLWEETLDEWTSQAIQQSIVDTLELLEQQEVPEINTDDNNESVSFYNLRTSLDKNYLRGDKLDQAETDSLINWFSLTSLYSEIHAQLLDEQKEQQNQLESGNQKVPFNENHDFNWSAVELMKIQRQVILTLQRRVTHKFAFYTANFPAKFQELLNKRLNKSLHEFKEQCLIQGGIFDRLAEIPLPEDEDEIQEVDDMMEMEQVAKAEEKAGLILKAWDNLNI